MSEKTKDGILKKGARKILKWLIILLVVAAVLVAADQYIKHKLPIIDLTPDAPQGEIDLTPDEVLGYNAIDFQQAVLGETRTKSELVVLERDAAAETVITNALANIEMFRKSRTIHTYGTGVYTVDLSGIGASAVTMDETHRLITVKIPAAALQYVTIDPSKTEVEEIDRSTFLAFGDIKLTAEQQALVDIEINDALTAELGDRDTLLMADKAAENAVRELLTPVVKAIAADYSVRVDAPERPEAVTDSAPADSAKAPDSAKALDSAA